MIYEQTVSDETVKRLGRDGYDTNRIDPRILNNIEKRIAANLPEFLDDEDNDLLGKTEKTAEEEKEDKAEEMVVDDDDDDDDDEIEKDLARREQQRLLAEKRCRMHLYVEPPSIRISATVKKDKDIDAERNILPHLHVPHWQLEEIRRRKHAQAEKFCCSPGAESHHAA